MERNKILIFGVLGGILLIVLIFVISFAVKSGGDGGSVYNTQATLSFWAVSDQASAYQTAINRFHTLYPSVKIDYRRFNDLESYENTLLNALASGEGPDIFVMKNNDLPRKANKIFPLPSSKYSLQSFQSDFPEVVENDFVSSGNIYALPASIDTLSLIYNKDIFDEEAVVFPPETWSEFRETVPNLTEFDGEEIARSGTAIGTSQNIGNSTDLVSLLMIQSGAKMVNEEYTRATFDSGESEEALNFYLQFSNPDSASYTWNDSFPEAIEAFTREKTAMVFGYARDLEEIKDRNSLLKAEVSEIPQIEGGRKIALARYFGYTVSRQTNYPGIAWDFIRTLTVDIQSVESYLEFTNQPPALRYLINKYKDDPELGVFMRQALIAESWREPDPERVDKIFNDMIEAVKDGRKGTSKAISDAEDEITNLMRRSF